MYEPITHNKEQRHMQQCPNTGKFVKKATRGPFNISLGVTFLRYNDSIQKLMKDFRVFEILTTYLLERER